MEAEVALPMKIPLLFQEAVVQPVLLIHNLPIHPMDHSLEEQPIAGADELENFVEAHLFHAHLPFRVHPVDHHTDHRNHVQILCQKKKELKKIKIRKNAYPTSKESICKAASP